MLSLFIILNCAGVSEKEKDHEVLRAASPVGGKRSNKSFQRHRKVVEISTNSMISKEPQANNTSNMPDFESKKQILPEKGKDTQDSSIKTLRIPQSSVAAAIIDRFIDKFRIVEGLSDPKPTLTTNPHHSVVREKRHSAVKSALNGSSANSQQPVRYSNIVDDVHPEHSLTGKDAESIRLREATLRACEVIDL